MAMFSLLQLLKAVIMARKSKRAALVLTLTAGQRAALKELAASRSAPAREVERAKVQLTQLSVALRRIPREYVQMRMPREFRKLVMPPA